MSRSVKVPKELAELTLLLELFLHDGKGHSRYIIYSAIARFPAIQTPEEKNWKTPSGAPWWRGRFSFDLSRLGDYGEVQNVRRGSGLWRITQKGRERLIRDWVILKRHGLLKETESAIDPYAANQINGEKAAVQKSVKEGIKMSLCHGCKGLGWVDSQHFGPTVCPICKGSGQVNNEVPTGETITRLPSTPPSNIIKRKSLRHWAFCEAVNQDDTNLIRYHDSVACWRAEIGDPKTTGYTGWENKDATDSFRHKGWGVAFGDPMAKEKGMQVIRPLKS